MMFLRLIRDKSGSVLVEATIMLTLMIFFVLGSIDFLLAFYEWNAATKAVQVGARLAAVSSPVASNLNVFSAALVSASLRPGSAMPSFTVICDGGTAKCRCEGTCLGGEIVFNAAALNTIVYGRGSKVCGDATSAYAVGMCDVFNRITPANVQIEYRQPSGTGRPWLCGASGRPRAYNQGLIAEHSVPVFLPRDCISRYSDAWVSDNENRRRPLLLLSDDKSLWGYSVAQKIC